MTATRVNGRHRMSPVDAAWLHMERRTNRSVVTSVMWFDDALAADAFRTVLQERLVDRFPRFSQRAVDRTTSVWWEDVEEMCIDDHLRYTRLPAPGGSAELQRYVSGLLGSPLERSRPLWEMHLVTGFAGAGCAIVARIHHCIADGMSLSRLMMSLTDDPREAESAGLADQPARDGGIGAALGRRTRRVVRASTRPVRTVRRATSATRSLARLVALPPDPHTALRGRVEVEKSVVWGEPISLQSVRDAAHAQQVTVNDLVLAAIGGALRAYLARTDGVSNDVRGLVPINLRPPQQPLPVELGNAFGLVYLSLPLSLDDPVERLREVRRRTLALKNSAEPFVSYRLLGLAGRLPSEAEQRVVDLFATKASVVITNVAGPRVPVCLAGKRVRGMIGWPPESGQLGLGLAVISYDGGIVIGAVADNTVIGDPARIVEDTGVELDRLVAASLVGA